MPKIKIQINSKLQYPNLKIELELRISVIVIYLLFVICDLEFFTVTYKFPLRSNCMLAARGIADP